VGIVIGTAIAEYGPLFSKMFELGNPCDGGGGGSGGSSGGLDPNKLKHIFGKPEHNLGNFLKKFGGDQEKAYKALEGVTQKYVNINNITGNFKDIVVNVNGIDITVRGTVINGVAKIGTAFIP
jgi:hypothetical protein